LDDVTRYGILNCNDAVHRTIDKALMLEHPESYVGTCTHHPITPYSFVLGEFYGLFYNQVPSLQYTLDRDLWSTEHYEFIAQLVNHKRWFDSTTNLPIEKWTPLLSDEYIRTWLQINGTDSGTRFVNGSLHLVNDFLELTGIDLSMVSIDVIDERTTRLDYLNEFGSYATAGLTLDTTQKFLDLFDIMNNFRLEYTNRDFNTTYTHFKRPGVNAIIYDDGSNYVQQINVTIPPNVYAESLEVWSVDGVKCASVHRKLVPGDHMSFECGGIFEIQADHSVRTELQEVIDSIIDGINGFPPGVDVFAHVLWAAGVFITTGINIRIVPTDYILMSPDTFHLQNVSQVAPFGPDSIQKTSRKDWPGITPFDVDYLVRTSSLTLTWIALSKQIIGQHKLPPNTVLEDVYEQCGDAVYSEDINVFNDLDKQYLYDFWATYLAPRHCSADWQVKKFSRDRSSTVCLFESFNNIPWRNGDPDLSNNVIGDEGGCQCHDRYSQGFWDPEHFCERCLNSDYGPGTIDEWSSTVQYQRDLLRLYPNYVTDHGKYPIYDPNEEPYATFETFEYNPDPEGLSVYLNGLSECDFTSAGPFDPNIEPYSIVNEALQLQSIEDLVSQLNSNGWCTLDDPFDVSQDPYLTISSYFQDPNPQGLVDHWNTTMGCRFPNDASTVVPTQICAGHGNLETEHLEFDGNISIVHVTTGGRFFTPKCTSLVKDNNESLTLELEVLSDRIELQTFVHDEYTINVISEQVFLFDKSLNETLTLELESCSQRYPQPFRCFYSDDYDEIHQLDCVNPSFFSNYAIEFQNELELNHRSFNQWDVEYYVIS